MALRGSQGRSEPARATSAPRGRRAVALAGAAALIASLGAPSIAAIAATSPASAVTPATFTVTGTADGVGSCSGSNACTTLRAAVAAANATSGATITIPAGTYTLTSSPGLVVKAPMTISGAGRVPGAGATTIDGNGTTRVLDVAAPSVSITGVVITNGNAGSGLGGGVLVESKASAFTMSGATVSNSRALAGGGLFIAGPSVLSGVTVNGNTATANGGGILVAGFSDPDPDDHDGGLGTGSLTLVNGTVVANTALAGGGINGAGPTTITYGTIAGNKSTLGNGGGVRRSYSQLTLTASVVAGNTAPSGKAPDCSGAPALSGFNLVQTLTGCSPTGATTIGASLRNADPQLGSLAPNGGPTLTEAIGPSSPAVDVIPSASCPAATTTDQRGTPRPANGACDLGAYEYVPLGIDVKLTADQTQVPAGAGAVDLSQLPTTAIPAATLSAPFSSFDKLSSPFHASPFHAASLDPAPFHATGIPPSVAPFFASPFHASNAFASPFHASPFHASPFHAAPFHAAPFHSSPFLEKLAAPFFASPLSNIPLDYAGGWPALLATIPNSPFAGRPDQNIAFSELLPFFDDTSSTLSRIPFGALDLSATGIYNLPALAFMLGRLSIADIPLANSGTTESSHLTAWCAVLGSSMCANLGVNPSDPTTAADIDLLALGFAGVNFDALGLDKVLLSSLSLSTLPVDSGGTFVGTPLGNYTWLGTLGLSLTRMGAIPLSQLNVTGIVACGSGTGAIDCSAAGGKTLADAEAANAFLQPSSDPTGNPVNLASLFAANPTNPVLSGETLGDAFNGLTNPADIPWQRLDLGTAQLQSASTPRVTPFHYTATFTLSGSPADTTVQLQLAPGFQYVPQSATFDRAAIADPTSTAVPGGVQLTFNLPGVGLGQHTIVIASVAGETLGSTPASVTAIASTASPAKMVTKTDSTNVTVIENFELGDTAQDTTSISPGVLQVAHISKPGDRDWYRFTIPAPDLTKPPRTAPTAKILLSNLAADFDLVLFGPAIQPLRGGPSQQLTPVKDGVLGVNPLGASLPAETLPDVPLTAPPGVSGVTVWGVSANRNLHDEEIDTGSLRPGDYYIQVSGYNGASSTQPYSLQLKTPGTDPVPACQPRSFANAVPNPPAAIDPTAYANADTLLLVDNQRLTAAFGPGSPGQPGANDVVGALGQVNGVGSVNGVGGVASAVVPIDGDPGVRSAYTNWDAHLCSVDAANAVVSAIGNVIDSITNASRNAHNGVSTIRNIVLVGADDQIPMARVPDGVAISNERSYGQAVANLSATSAATPVNNELVSALSNGYILTDNPYGTARSVAVDGHELFVPQVGLGRLVKTPGDIVTALTKFKASNGELDPTTALSAGYDFLAPGARAVAQQLTDSGIPTDTSLINETWTRADLAAKLLANPAPGLALLNAHADFYRALPAIGNATGSTSDPFTVNDIINSPGTDLSKTLLFTMGCHAGLSVSDVSVGVPTADWSQVLSGRGALYAANTGFGYGDTDAVALGEELMRLFSQQLTSAANLGTAMAQAKQLYFTNRPVVSPYDEKTLQEVVFYGLPMYHVKTPSQSTPGTAISLSPAAGNTATFSFDATKLHLNTTARGRYFDIGGQTLTDPNRPIEPQTAVDVTPGQPGAPPVSSQSGIAAHGALITALTSTDYGAFDPVYQQPTVGPAANQPEPSVGDAPFPAGIQQLTRGSGSSGDFQRLVLVPGQFRDPVPNTGVGVQRLFTNVQGTVLYGSSTNFQAPTIYQTTANGSNIAVATDKAARVLVLARDLGLGGSVTWQALDLATSDGGTTWAGALPSAGTGRGFQFIVQAVDTSGNVSVSSDKAIDFVTAQPLPSGTVTIQLPTSPITKGFFTVAPSVTLSSAAGGLSYAVDGGTFTPLGDGTTVSVTVPDVDGSHLIQARDANFNSSIASYKIDSHPPTVTATLTDQAQHAVIPSSTFAKGPVAVNLLADDGNGSGVAGISYTLSGATTGTGTFGSTGLVTVANEGLTTVTYTTTDNVGNTSAPQSVVVKIDTTPPTLATPTLTGPKNVAPATWVMGPVTVGLAADDGTGSGVATISYTTSTTPPGGGAPITSPPVSVAAGSTSVQITAEGQTTVSYSATDKVGNVSSGSVAVWIDNTAPAVSCPSADTMWHGANVTLTCTATDNGSGLAPTSPPTFTLSTSVGAGAASISASTGTAQVCDVAGNCVTAGPIINNQVDLQVPTVTAAVTDQKGSPVPTSGWFTGPVNVTVSANDAAGSGIASITYSTSTAPATGGGPPVVTGPTTVSVGQGVTVTGGVATLTVPVSADGLTTFSYSATDAVGNTVAPPQTTAFKVDSQGPTITITTPAADGSTVIPFGGSLTPVFTCADGTGSGIAGCAATTPIVTSSPGPQAFTVKATDIAGNTSTRSVTYTVAYRICLDYNPTDQTKIGQVVDIEFRFCDAAGTTVALASPTILATSVDGKPLPPNTLTGNFAFLKYFGDYNYYLKTGGSAWSTVGQHRLTFTVNGVSSPSYNGAFTLR